MPPLAITEETKSAVLRGLLYRRISSAAPRSLAAVAWIRVSCGGVYSVRTAGGVAGCLGVLVGVGETFGAVFGFAAYDGIAGGGFLVEGLAAAWKGVVCVKDLICVALLRSSLRSGCEDIVFFFFYPGPR